MINKIKTATLKALLILTCLYTALLLLYTIGIDNAINNYSIAQTFIYLVILSSILFIAKQTNNHSISRKNWKTNEASSPAKTY